MFQEKKASYLFMPKSSSNYLLLNRILNPIDWKNLSNSTTDTIKPVFNSEELFDYFIISLNKHLTSIKNKSKKEQFKHTISKPNKSGIGVSIKPVKITVITNDLTLDFDGLVSNEMQKAQNDTYSFLQAKINSEKVDVIQSLNLFKDAYSKTNSINDPLIESNDSRKITQLISQIENLNEFDFSSLTLQPYNYQKGNLASRSFKKLTIFGVFFGLLAALALLFIWYLIQLKDWIKIAREELANQEETPPAP